MVLQVLIAAFSGSGVSVLMLAHGKARVWGVLLLVLTALPIKLLWLRRKGPMRPVQVRYLKEFLPSMLAYALVVGLLFPLAGHVQAQWLKALIAITPMLPLTAAMVAMMRMVMRSDELEQRLHLIALSVASGVVGLLSMTGGFLAAAHVVRLDGTILIWVFPVLMVAFGLSRWCAARIYGMSGDCM